MITNNEKNPLIINYRLTGAKCQRCRYEWRPIIERRPVKCPNCQCRKWDSYQPPKKQVKQTNEK